MRNSIFIYEETTGATLLLGTCFTLTKAAKGPEGEAHIDSRSASEDLAKSLLIWKISKQNAPLFK